MKTLMSRDFEGRYRIPILYEDDYILAVNKPAGLLSIPDHWVKEKANLKEILSNYVRKEYGIDSIFVVHRLDKETSGVLLFAKNAAVHRELNRQFESGEVQKRYLALVAGRLEAKEGVIDAPISRKMIRGGRKLIDEKKGLPSRTRYRVLEEFETMSLVEVKPETGRMHQIRLHFAHIGHPLLIDDKYHPGGKDRISIRDLKPAARVRPDDERAIMERLALHAESLVFRHPVTGALQEIHAELPKDFRSVLNHLRKYSRTAYFHTNSKENQ